MKEINAVTWGVKNVFDVSFFTPSTMCLEHSKYNIPYQTFDQRLFCCMVCTSYDISTELKGMLL